MQRSPICRPPRPGKRSGLRCRSVEKECATSTGLRCDVVTFYSGEVYNLYKYKKYTDVRLVFAPEFDIAFFGGDPDNFTYPRYDLDITFFRVYENDKPAHIEHYLRWSTDRRKGQRTDLCLRPPGIHRPTEDDGPARIPARRRLPLAS